MAKLRKSRIQSHFQFKQFHSLYNAPPRKDDVSRIYTVEDSFGKQAKASSNEFWVAEALKELGVDFQFQVSVAGGKGLAFGVVLDFLVYTMPMPVALWVHGEHWHTGADKMRDDRAKETVASYMKGEVLLAEIWGNESSDKELATLAVRRKIL